MGFSEMRQLTKQGKLDRCLVNGQFNREGFGFLFLIYKHNLDKGLTLLTTYRGVMHVRLSLLPWSSGASFNNNILITIMWGVEITDLANFKVQVWSKFRNLFLLT